MYLPRLIDSLLNFRLKTKGATLIEGPKWCGKTFTASQQANSILNLAKPNILAQTRNLIQIDPDKVLEGAVPRLIDEWQEIPIIWDYIRNEVDQRQAMGQFILTGSAVPLDSSKIIHTGTGRISRLFMRTMSLWESKESNGVISLDYLFKGGDKITSRNDKNLDDIAFITCRGGWPLAVTMEGEEALQQAIDYYDAVVNIDVIRTGEGRKSTDLIKKIMRSYARNIGYQTPNTTILKDVSKERSHDVATIADYINSLKAIYVVEEMRSWNPNLRSKTSIRTSDTRYFTDPSIGCAALGIGPGDLINDLKTFGMMFENLCIRDLRIYSQTLDGEVFHYRDSYGLECDAVIHLRNGKYGLVEIKLGGENQIEEACHTLKKFENNIDVASMSSPAFKMVLTAVGEYAYCRKDNIWVVPLPCLKN